ncbi:MAG: hypothetical protein Alpg2KO_03100 [Alphaproteobacteria bacterium]
MQRFIGLAILLVVIVFVVGHTVYTHVAESQTIEVPFARGSSLTDAGKNAVAEAAQALRADDGLGAVIEGHTGTNGDAAANLALSEQRAETVADELRGLGIASDRIQTTGLGGGSPLPRDADESERNWQSRNSRVEIILKPAGDLADSLLK